MKWSDKDSSSGFIFHMKLSMYVSLHSPRALFACARQRPTLPWTRSALRLMAFAAFSGSAIGRAYACAAP